MKSSRNIIFLFIFVTGLLACRKDKPFSNPSSNNNTEWVDNLVCMDYPDSIYIYSHAWGRYQYRTPYFNPNNSNEFIYSYYDYETNQQQLIKYNMLTKQKLVLSNLGIYKQPKWNKNGWIAFSNMHHVHVVKEDGGDYRQVSENQTGSNLFPFWENNNLYWQHSTNTSVFQLKQSINQLTVDTVTNGRALFNTDIQNHKALTIRALGPNSPTYYGFHYMYEASLFDINNFNIISECSKPLNGITWHPSGDFFYASHFFTDNKDERGLFKITLSGQAEKIMEYCQSKRYSNISCSSDGKFIIGERTARHLEQYDPYSGRIIQNSTIWLINTETMEETKINLE